MTTSQDDTALLWFVAFFWMISVACAIRLWMSPASIGRKILWTLILAVPFLGPVFYGGMYKPPSVQDEHLQGKWDINRHGT